MGNRIALAESLIQQAGKQQAIVIIVDGEDAIVRSCNMQDEEIVGLLYNIAYSAGDDLPPLSQARN